MDEASFARLSVKDSTTPSKNPGIIFCLIIYFHYVLIFVIETVATTVDSNGEVAAVDADADADNAPLGPYGFVVGQPYVATESQRNEPSPQGPEAVEGRPILNEDGEEVGFVPRGRSKPNCNGGSVGTVKSMLAKYDIDHAYYGTGKQVIELGWKMPLVQEWLTSRPTKPVVMEPSSGKHELIVKYLRADGLEVISLDKFFGEGVELGWDMRSKDGYSQYLFDLIVANPPFPFKDELLELFFDLGIPFMVLLPQDILANKRTRATLQKNHYTVLTGIKADFVGLDGSKKSVRSVVMWLFGNFPNQPECNLIWNAPPNGCGYDAEDEEQG